MILNQLFKQKEKKNLEIKEKTIVDYATFDIAQIASILADLISIYEKEKLTNRRNAILKQLENIDSSNQEEIKQLENELNDIILKLVKVK